MTTPAPPAPGAPTPAPPKPVTSAMTDERPVVTTHELRLSGRALRYRATTGLMPLRSEAGEIDANLFYVAYTLDPAPEAARRPLTICFNGGPGAASVWLHLGAIGPRRVRMTDEGLLPPAPYTLADNEATWLDKSDLVFVDPVGTGYSRARNNDVARRYFGLRGDIESVGQFIRQYLTQAQRWGSPLFLAGESYGTTRAAGLSNYLVEHGIALNGVFLISTILNFQTARFAPGNDLPYTLFLPTYTATAWYHKKLAAELQGDLQKALAESRQFADTAYLVALQKGDALSAGERRDVADRLSRLTGLDRGWLERANLRVEIQRFCKELLRDRGQVVGRLDSRILGTEPNANDETPEADPSLAAIRPPYTAAFNQYVRGELNYTNDREYYVLGGGITAPWDFGVSSGPGGQGYADTSEALRRAFSRNPYMKLFVAQGYFDLATPFHAAEYTLRHMGLDPALKGSIRTAEYEAGHMMYVHVPSLRKLKRDVDQFYDFVGGVAGR